MKRFILIASLVSLSALAFAQQDMKDMPGMKMDKPKTQTTKKPGDKNNQNVGTQKVIYTCVMHPEIKMDKPGNCPKCGMALEPVSNAPLAPRTEYVCPMHPEIVRTEPGNCPICGMALEPRTGSVSEDQNPELKYMQRRFWTGVA